MTWLATSAMCARLILLPQHPDYPYPRVSEGRDPLNSDVSPQLVGDNVPLTRDKLHEYMLANSIKGNKIMPRRSPFIGDTKTFVSPIDKTTQFVIRRLSVAQVMSYRDRNSVVRYVTEEESGKYTTERDYPAGTMNVDLAALGLASWNIQDTNGNDIKVAEDTIKAYLDPEELDFIAEKVLEINPILSNRERQKSKTESDPLTTTGSGTGGNEPSSVSQLLQTATNGTTSLSGNSIPTQLSTAVVGVQTAVQSADRSPILS